ncbi:MAG: septum formation initiator family protein [Marinomonas sp.]
MPKVSSINKALSRLSPDQTRKMGVLAALLVLAALAIAGPTGLLAWNENANVLEERAEHIAKLSQHRDELAHRVALLDMKGADADLAGELIRQNLNVVHPDEIVITLGE